MLGALFATPRLYARTDHTARNDTLHESVIMHVGSFRAISLSLLTLDNGETLSFDIVHLQRQSHARSFYVVCVPVLIHSPNKFTDFSISQPHSDTYPCKHCQDME